MGNTLSRVNSSAATLTKNRTEGSIVPTSGMCVTCVDGCIGMCEIGKSAYRGPEVIYPQPFGVITTAAEKIYPVDYSHFNIMGTAVGAYGIEADSDKAIFPAVNLEVVIGQDRRIKFRFPWILSGIGSVRNYQFHVVSNRTFPSKDLFVKDAGAPADVVSMNGYIMDGRVHAHLMLSNPDHAFGGHLEPGTNAFTFVAMTLGVLPDSVDISRIDDKTYR